MSRLPAHKRKILTREEVRIGFLDIILFGLSRAYSSGLVSLSDVSRIGEAIYFVEPVYRFPGALAIPNTSR